MSDSSSVSGRGSISTRPFDLSTLPKGGRNENLVFSDRERPEREHSANLETYRKAWPVRTAPGFLRTARGYLTGALATIQPCLVLLAGSVSDGGSLEEDEAPAPRVDTTAPAVAPLYEACLFPPKGYAR